MDNRVRRLYHYVIILSPTVVLWLSVQCPWQAHVFEHWAQLVVLWESWSLASRTTRGGLYLYFSLLPCEGHLQACTMAGSWAVSSSSPLRTETPWNYKLLSPSIGHFLTMKKKIMQMDTCLPSTKTSMDSIFSIKCLCWVETTKAKHIAPRISGGQELCLCYWSTILSSY